MIISMKVTPNNIVFVPLKVKDIEALKNHFEILSRESKDFDWMFERSEFFAIYFTNLLKMFDIY